MVTQSGSSPPHFLFRMSGILIFAVFVNGILAQSRYPIIYPRFPATSASVVQSGHWYGNGTHTYSSSVDFPAWKAFDGNLATSWLSSASYPGGIYNGSSTLLGHSGDWIQMSLPVNISLSQYSIKCSPQSTTLCPSTVVVAAASHPSSLTWTIVAQTTGLTSWGSRLNFNVSSTSLFSVVRFIFKSANAQAGTAQIAITEAYLWGIERMSSHNHMRF